MVPSMSAGRKGCGGPGVLALVALVLAGTMTFLAESEARDMLVPKEQEVTQFGEIDVAPLDQVNWTRPQSIFKWIAMACGWEVPQDLQGRPGWFGAPRISPKVPAVSEFPPEQAAVYIVYEIPSLSEPMQMNADWYVVGEQGKPASTRLGQDGLFMDMNEPYGYLEVRQPEDGWSLGEYVVNIYVSSPGQQLHALSQVGTMKFTISNSEEAVRTSERCEAAGPQLDVIGY